MPQVSKLNYYDSAFNIVADFLNNHKKGSRIHYYLRPDNYLINLSSHFLTHQIFYPSIKSLYSFSGRSVVWVSGNFSTRLSSWIDDFWHDPIDTQTLLKMATWIQATSLPFSLRKAIKLPLIGALDKCWISFSRHVYVLSKGSSALLSIPGKIHSYMDWGRGDATTLIGKGWQWIKVGTKFVSNALITLISTIVRLVVFPLEYVPLVNKLLQLTRRGIQKTMTYLELNLNERAHRVLHHGEKTIRRKVVAKVAEISFKQSTGFVTNFALRTLLGVAVYSYAKHRLAGYIGSHEIPDQIALRASQFLTAVVGGLWAHSIGLMLYDLHGKYQEDFDAEASTLMELAGLVNKQNLYKVLQLVKTIITK